MSLRLSKTFILFTLVIDAIGIGLIMPVMPDLIQEVQGTNLSNAAVWGGLLSFTYAIMQFLFGPILGAISDRYGRRIVLLVSLAAMALDYLLMAVAHTIFLLFIGRVIGGITAATQPTASAFMADISRPEEKARNFGLVSAAFGVGFVFGPILGGAVAEAFGVRGPFIAAAILAGLNFVFGCFVLPETVTDSNRRDFQWSRANPFGAFRSISALPGLGALLFVNLLYSIGFYVYPSVWPYFAQYRYDWSPLMVGNSLALFGISMAVTQGLIIGQVVKKVGEQNTVRLALFIAVIALLLIGTLNNGWVVLVLIPLSALGAMATPALQGIMSRIAADDQQGELQGVLTSITAISIIISPLLMTSMFYLGTREGIANPMPGAPFYLAALLMMAAFGVYLRSYRKVTL